MILIKFKKLSSGIIVTSLLVQLFAMTSTSYANDLKKDFSPIKNTNSVFTENISNRQLKGAYIMESALASNLVIELDKDEYRRYPYMNFNNGGKYQQWNFIYDANKKAYKIASTLRPDMYLKAARSGNTFQLMVGPHEEWESDIHWIVEDAGNGYVYLRSSQRAGKYIDTSDIEESRIFATDFKGSQSQKFKLKSLTTFNNQ